MNTIPDITLKKANEAAIYNLYLYLAHKTTPANKETLKSIITGLEVAYKTGKADSWTDRDINRLNILKNAADKNPALANSRIDNLTRSKSGLTACSFTNPNGNVFVSFRGTGSGEWIDNGEGLSGIPEENTYLTYIKGGKVVSRKTVKEDYATDQQVEALNWFYSIASKNGWNNRTWITLSGHSKGGNKAQFVAINSDLVDDCYSFDGQGFSPEAIDYLKDRYKERFEMRRQNIYSLSTDNDYVNVLGERLVPENQIYYFESQKGLHYPEAILDANGKLLPLCEQGKLSKYIEAVSNELMNLEPFIRQYATLGIMNVFQKHLGEGKPVNNDSVSIEKTIAGIGVAIGILFNNLRKIKEGYEISDPYR